MPRGRRSEQLTIILDENIAGDELREALRPIAAQHAAVVELLSAHHERGTPDEVWLEAAGKLRWASSRTTCTYAVARRNAGAIAFILRGKGLNGDQIRDALVAALPGICRKARQLAPPVICHVSRDGEIRAIIGERRGAVRRK